MAPPKKRPADLADVVTETRDMQLFEAEATPIGVFLRNLRSFLADAHGLEEQAADRLAEAKRFKTPKTAADDERLQVYIKTNNALKKKIEDHWYTIANALYALHRKVTGYRGRGVQVADEGTAIVQRLHNGYVLEARRIADERERQLRIAEEKRQQAIRQAELDELERQARETRNREEKAAIREQAAATKAAPLDVQVEPVKPAISRAPGASDRVTKSARVLDAEKLRTAIIAGGFGIPYDVLTIDEAKLNSYARSLGKRINEWPGVQYVETTRTV